MQSVDDSIPNKMIDANKFDKVFTTIISQQIYTYQDGKIITNTMHDIVKNNVELKKGTLKLSKVNFRVEHLEFEIGRASCRERG